MAWQIHRGSSCPIVLVSYVPDDEQSVVFPQRLVPAVNHKLWTSLVKMDVRIGGTVERVGGTYFFRYAPLEHGHGLGTTLEDIDRFVEQIPILLVS